MSLLGLALLGLGPMLITVLVQLGEQDERERAWAYAWGFGVRR